MKNKIYSIVVVLLLSLYYLNASAQVSFGVKSGLNVSSFSMKDMEVIDFPEMIGKQNVDFMLF